MKKTTFIFVFNLILETKSPCQVMVLVNIPISTRMLKIACRPVEWVVAFHVSAIITVLGVKVF